MYWYNHQLSGRKTSLTGYGWSAVGGCGAGLLFGIGAGEIPWVLGSGLGFGAAGTFAAGGGVLAGSEPSIPLFRAVSQQEFDTALQEQAFSAGSNSLGGKFFAESIEDAAAWGEQLNGAGEFKILQADLPASAADSLMRWESLDGIGPARYGELWQLNVPGLRITEVPWP